MAIRALVSDRVFVLLCWALVILATAFVSLPALNGGFLFDDGPNIVENKAIHLQQFSWADIRDSLAASAAAGPLGRPVSVVSFALTHIAFGLDPYAFKAINLLIHLANGILASVVVAQLLSMIYLGPMTDRLQRWLPLWVGAAWLLHPIHFVAINMVVQRMTLLATLFTFMALIAHLCAMRSDRTAATQWIWLAVAWCVFWPLAILSKETGLLFPGLVLLIACCQAQNPAGGGAICKRGALITVVAIALAGSFLYWKIGLGWLEAGYMLRDFTMTERLLTQSRVLWFYLGQILLPAPASFSVYLDWFPVSRGWLQPPTTCLAVFGWGLVLPSMWALRKQQPMLFFGVGWFLVGHALESTIIPLEIAHEHRNYLPALGPLLALGYWGGRLFGRLGFEPPYVATIASAAILAYFGSLTAMRSLQMGDPLIGSQIEASRHENSARANYVAATRLMRGGYGGPGDLLGAKSVRHYFEQAERADKNFKVGYLGLIVWACASDRAVESQWLAELRHRLEETPFSHGQVAMPAFILKPLVEMPQCLSRQAALSLFESGSRNLRLSNGLRAEFFDAAAEYELLVSHDPHSARDYYVKASKLDGSNIRLKQKIEGLTTAK